MAFPDFFNGGQRVAKLTMLLAGLALLSWTSVHAQEQTHAAVKAGPIPSISLSPSAVMLQGKPGESYTQALHFSNHTPIPLTFEMEAMDLVVRDGKRAFLAAGEIPQSIAATAVFSTKQVTVQPNQTATVNATLTVPVETPVRAVVLIFHGTNQISTHSKAKATASLGALLTFNLSQDIEVDGAPIEVTPQTATSNATVSQWFTNTGREPVVMSGVAAILDQSGTLVAKAPIAAHRLLPGERLQFKAEIPMELRAGSYRAFASLLCAGKTITHSAAFVVD
jgi:hypothetical protein